MLTIEPFENALRENTPLTSINDSNSLVEYLNQINLKGHMVLDELKKVSNDRDSYKQQLDEAEKRTKEAWDEVANLRGKKVSKERSEESEKKANGSFSEDDDAEGDNDPLGAASPRPLPLSLKSPTLSVRGMSLFLPKSKFGSPRSQQGSEDLFSYDGEVPKMENELQERKIQIGELEHEVKSLKGDLAVTRESTQSMVQSLEEATRELNGLRDSKERSESEIKDRQESLERARSDLQAAEAKLKELNIQQGSRDQSRMTDLEDQLKVMKDELDTAKSSKENDTDSAEETNALRSTVSRLESDIQRLRAAIQKREKDTDGLNGIVSSLRNQLTEARDKIQDLNVVIEKSSKAYETLRGKVGSIEAGPYPSSNAELKFQPESSITDLTVQGPEGTDLGASAQDISNAGKKKNKKKKKAGKGSAEHDKEPQLTSNIEPQPSNGSVAESQTAHRLQEELRQLRVLLQEKDAAIDRLSGKINDQDGLRDEIEILRDDLINVGQEHVEAKDKIKGLTSEKAALEATVTGLEKELSDLRVTQISNKAGSEQKRKDLAAQFDDLNVKATALQTDLSAAQHLASSRFKELNDLKSILQKAQPEINALKSEAAELQTVREALTKRDVDFKRLDSRHEVMRSELAGLKKVILGKDSELKSLTLKIGQETSGRAKAEDASEKASQSAQRMEAQKRQVADSFDRLSKELTKAQQDLLACKTRLKETEQQLAKNRSDSEGFREEIELKTAQYASAQSLMASMRDQTAEMAMQMKESRERCESLDEEVAEAHRLLGERSREGETMRRLLAEVEGRADSRTREMKERMETAIEERDRAEDEASTAARRRTREVEDLRNQFRDMERNYKRAEEDKEELDVAQREWKRRREELEYRAGQNTKEVDEVRKAMAELRDALDGSERQARDLEKQKAELRRSVEDTQHRLEKLQKSNKVLPLSSSASRPSSKTNEARSP